MVRISDTDNCRVHLLCPTNPQLTLCGMPSGTAKPDLFGGAFTPWPRTTARVTCMRCATVVCQIRNTPYNVLDDAIDTATLDAAIYDAVKTSNNTTSERR